jgi:hypothetical protein
LKRFCFRNLFIKGDDITIARVTQNYFEAVKKTWPIAWEDFSQGSMLNKTNGFRALMAIFGRVYTHVAAPGEMVDVSRLQKVFTKSKLKDQDFNTDRFKPGTSGETRLRNELLDDLFG